MNRCFDVLEKSLIFPVGSVPFETCHASNICFLRNGELAAAWFAGKKGSDDVSVWTARTEHGVWGTPVRTAHDIDEPHWNPVLYERADGTLILFYKVGRVIADWYTDYRTSDDCGKTFSEPQELVPGDRGGRGPVRCKVITGMVQTAEADPDGITLGAVTVELDMFPFQGKSDLTYESFDSIVMPIAAPAALIVQADAPYNSLDEFVAYCQENPGSVQVGNSGAGAIWDLATYLMEDEFGIVVVHVPYPNGTADIAAAISGGHIEATLADPSSFMSQIEAGTLKCLGVMADDRTTNLPDVPTFKELGHDLAVRAWATLVAPKGLDEEILTVLREAVETAMNSDECKEYFLNQGIDPTAYVGEDADKIMADDYAMYEKVFSEYSFDDEE